MGRGVYRGVYSALVDDDDFQRLPPDARLTLMVARASKEAGPAGIWVYYPEVLMRQTGLTRARLEAAVRELEAGNWVFRDGPLMWIRNALRHDPHMRLSDDKHRKAVEDWIRTLPKRRLVLSFCDYYRLPRPFDGPSEALRRPHPQEKDKDKDKEKEEDKEEERAHYAPAPPAPSRGAQLGLESTDDNGQPPTAVPFRIPASIVSALDRAPTLGQLAKLRDPSWWQAEIRAHPSLDMAAEILSLEAWMKSNPARAPRKNVAAWVHRCLNRPKRDE